MAIKLIDKSVDAEMKQFQADLLRSVAQMKKGLAARTTRVLVTPASTTRARVGLTQSQFSELLGVSVRTLQDWEQGRRDPTGAAQRCRASPQSIQESCADWLWRNS